MKPLAVLKFYKNNKKRFVSIFTAIVLSTFLLYTVQMLISSSFRTTYCAFVEPQKYFTSIISKEKVLETDLVNRIKEMGEVEKILPCAFHYTNFASSISGNTGTRIYTVKNEDMKLLISKMDLTLAEGRLPEPGTNEIVLHRSVAANKKLNIGDKIGGNIQKDEVLQGERVIVGLVDGKSIVSFDSMEYWMEKNEVSNEFLLGMIIFPKEGKLIDLERQLDSLDTSGTEVRTFYSAQFQYGKNIENINILLTLINIMVIIIVSMCIGFISYIYFFQRRTEFGILSAIGYTEQQIINRAFAEIAGINIIGLAAGVLLSLLTGAVLNIALYVDKGEPLILWSLDYITRACCVPLFAVLFSVIPVWRMLKKLDPVAIIEGGLDYAD